MATQDLLTCYYIADGSEVVEVEHHGRMVRVFFDNPIDLQIDLFDAGLSGEAIATVLLDIDRAKEQGWRTAEDFSEFEPAPCSHSYAAQPACFGCHELELRLGNVKAWLAAALFALALLCWRIR